MGKLMSPYCGTCFETRVEIDKLDESWWLCPIGDLHAFSHLHANDSWLRLRKDIRKLARSGRVFGIGMGDYCEFNSPSERALIEAAHESTVLRTRDVYRIMSDRISEELESTRLRWLGLIEGHHFGDMGVETTTEYMCRKLKCNYLSAITMYRLLFVYGKEECSVDICAYHGTGNARLYGGSLNKVQYMAEDFIANIYLMGHDHKIVGAANEQLAFTKIGGVPNVIAHPHLYVRTGGMMKGFVKDMPSYVTQRGGGSRPLRLPRIELIPRKYEGSRQGFHVEMFARV